MLNYQRVKESGYCKSPPVWCYQPAHGPEAFASPLLPSAFQQLHAETGVERARRRQGRCSWKGMPLWAWDKWHKETGFYDILWITCWVVALVPNCREIMFRSQVKKNSNGHGVFPRVMFFFHRETEDTPIELDFSPTFSEPKWQDRDLDVPCVPLATGRDSTWATKPGSICWLEPLGRSYQDWPVGWLL